MKRIDDLPLEEILRLRTTEPQQLTDAELSTVLRDRYTADPVPPCPVCGDVLSVATCGGGQATVYACSEWKEDQANSGKLLRKPNWSGTDDHYMRSRWTTYRGGDDHVLELLRRFGAA
jgi:hypothetical protein